MWSCRPRRLARYRRRFADRKEATRTNACAPFRRASAANLDIKQIRAGATLLLPCYVDGCGLAIGDMHYAQGDGEVAGTAIEMAATVACARNSARPSLDRQLPR